jgi:photosystem II stability/assembly factor-like uncharacterized protein
MTFRGIAVTVITAAGILILSACGTFTVQVETQPAPPKTFPTPPRLAPTSTPILQPAVRTATPSQASPVKAPPSQATPSQAATTTEVIPGAARLAPGTAVNMTRIQMQTAQAGWAIGAPENDPIQHILLSSDNGHTWQDHTPPAALAEKPADGQATSAYFASPDEAWVSFSSQVLQEGQSQMVVWHTADGGKTWEGSQPLDFSSLQMEFHIPSDLGFRDSTQGWIMVHLGAGMSHDYIAVLTTSDGGKSWQRVIDPNTQPNLMSCYKTGLTFTSTTEGWLTGNCPGLMPTLFFYHTTDGGTNWSEATLPVPNGKPADYYAQIEGCGIPAIDNAKAGTLSLTLRCSNFNNNTTQSWLYTSSNGGAINSNGGVTWEQHLLPIPYNQITMLSPAEGFLVGSLTEDPEANGTVYHTVDGGGVWTLLISTSWTGAPDFVDSKNGWVVATHNQLSALVYTSNGGVTWVELNPVISS